MTTPSAVLFYLMGNLASTYWNQGRWIEAEDLQVWVMEIMKRVLGADHPDTLSYMANLANILKMLQRDKEALELMQQAWQMRVQKLGSDHPFTKNTKNTIDKWQNLSLS